MALANWGSTIWPGCAPSSADFYKSMTTHADHRIWQDVYHAKIASRAEAYLKLTVIDDVLIVSFKEL
jgi:motility quorum-sensing regulator/GCU-specific mRNA interferase toxin